MIAYEVRLWKNDAVKSQITVQADSAAEALGQYLSNTGWPDARGWEQDIDEREDTASAADPDDPHCMIEAVLVDRENRLKLLADVCDPAADPDMVHGRQCSNPACDYTTDYSLLSEIPDRCPKCRAEWIS